jgi:hypothetical protein
MTGAGEDLSSGIAWFLTNTFKQTVAAVWTRLVVSCLPNPLRDLPRYFGLINLEVFQNFKPTFGANLPVQPGGFRWITFAQVVQSLVLFKRGQLVGEIPDQQILF